MYAKLRTSELLYSEVLPIQHVYCVLEFHAEAQQATASEGLDQGPYVADSGIRTCDPLYERRRIYQ